MYREEDPSEEVCFLGSGVQGRAFVPSTKGKLDDFFLTVVAFDEPDASRISDS
jgi:hypothetical protein